MEHTKSEYRASSIARNASLIALAFVGVALTSELAHAQARGDVSAAGEAYSRAQQAELRGDFSAAAELYALADQIAPAPQALRSAASAAHRANMDATAATYAAELLARDAIDPTSRAVAEEILRDTESRLARIVARCDPACRVLVDGRVATRNEGTEHVLYVRPGARRIAATYEGGARTEPQSATLVAGQRFDVAFETPRVAEAPSTDGDDDTNDGGISPAVFVTAATLTAVGGGLVLWSGMEVNRAHDDYDRTDPDAAADYARGRDLERRANTFIGVTGALAVGTVVIGILTDWDGDADETSTAVRTRHAPMIYADRDGALVSYTRTFH